MPAISFGDGANSSAEAASQEFSELLARLQDAHDQQVQTLRSEIQRLLGTTAAACRATRTTALREEQELDLPGFANESPAAPLNDPAKLAWKSEREGVGSATAIIPGPGAEASSEAAPSNFQEKNMQNANNIAKVFAVAKMFRKLAGSSEQVEATSTTRNTELKQPSLPFVQKRTSVWHSGHRSLWTFVEDLINRPWFDSFFCALIFVNALIMGMEAHYRGVLVGASLEHEAVDPNTDEANFWPGAETAFMVIDNIFGVLFLLEVVAKVIGLRRKFLLFTWNWIDTCLVCLWLAGLLGEEVLPVKPSSFRLLRLARLMRLIRLAHTIQGFDALYLISTSLQSSLTILAWTSVMFFLLQLAVALFLNQILAEFYFLDESFTQERRREVYTYFGTFSRSLFSMFEVTLANWPPVCRALSENVSEVFMLLGVAHKLTIGFAFVGVINGVFMQETFKVASTDDRIMMKDRERLVSTHRKKMELFFRMADSSGDGEIDIDEFRQMLSNSDVRLWISSMGLEANDSDALFTLIDNESDGHITLDELIAGVGRLKGAARSIDVVKLVEEVRKISSRLKHDPDNLD